MWQALLKHLVMPASSLLTPHKAWRYYHQYLAADHDDPGLRRARIWDRLQGMLRHAYREVPHFRDRLDGAGIRPAQIRTWADFRQIPVMTKHDLREAFPDRVIADNHRHRRLRYSNTSGSTGRKLVLAQDIRDVNHRYATRLRARALEGSFVGDRTVRLTPNECQPCTRSGAQAAEHYSLLERRVINPYIQRRLMLPPVGPQRGQMGPELFDRYLRQIESYHPRLWYTYPLYAYLMAKHLRRTGQAAPEVGIIDLAGGVLSPKMRALISDTFRAPCFEGYGGGEFGRYANSCASSGHGLHVAEDFSLVEFIRPDGQPAEHGELANLVVTSLTNHAMPIIRLEQADVAVPRGTTCGCGRTAPLMEVMGRLQTMIVPPDGDAVPEKTVIDALIDFPGLEWFQLIQQEEQAFRLLVIPDPSAGATLDRGGLADLAHATIGLEAGVVVDVEVVDHIAQETSGKYMHVKSCTYDRFRCVSREAMERDRHSERYLH